MISVSTTIFKELSVDDIKSLESLGFESKKVKVYEYKEAGIQKVVKFVFADFSIINFIRDGLLWEGLNILAKNTFKIAKSKGYSKNIHYWIRDVDGEYPINIAFMANGKQDIEKAISSLSKFMPEVVKKYKPRKKEIVWLSCNLKIGKWKVKVF